jgi:hypothetical protein
VFYDKFEALTQGSIMRRMRHGAQQRLWRDGKPSSRAIPANSGLAADHRERLSQRYSEWDLHFLSAIERGSTCRRIRYRMFSQPGGLWAK